MVRTPVPGFSRWSCALALGRSRLPHASLQTRADLVRCDIERDSAPLPTVYALPLLSAFLDVSGQLLLVAAYAVTGMEVKDLGPIATDAAAGDGGVVVSSVTDAAESALDAVTDLVRRHWQL